MMQADKTAKKSERVITPMAPGLLARINLYRFNNRIESRSAAIRRLIERGLEAEKKGKAK